MQQRNAETESAATHSERHGSLDEAMARFGHLPRSRKEALKARSEKYFTAKPCNRGHYAPRYTKWAMCQACLAEDAANRRVLIKRVLAGEIEVTA